MIVAADAARLARLWPAPGGPDSPRPVPGRSATGPTPTAATSSSCARPDASALPADVWLKLGWTAAPRDEVRHDFARRPTGSSATSLTTRPCRPSWLRACRSWPRRRSRPRFCASPAASARSSRGPPTNTRSGCAAPPSRRGRSRWPLTGRMPRSPCATRRAYSCRRGRGRCSPQGRRGGARKRRVGRTGARVDPGEGIPPVRGRRPSGTLIVANSAKFPEPLSRGSIRPKFAPSARAGEATLWRVDGPLSEVATGLCDALPEKILGQLLVAAIEHDGRPACLIRPAKSFAEGSELPGEPMRMVAGLPLWLPARQELRPPLRRDWLREAFVGDSAAAWLEAAPEGVVPNRVRQANFIALPECVEWLAPAAIEVRPIGAEFGEFSLAAFHSETEPVPNRPRRERAPDDIEVEPYQIPNIQVRVGQRPPKKVEPEFVPEWVMPAKPAAMREELNPFRPTNSWRWAGRSDEPRKLAYWPKDGPAPRRAQRTVRVAVMAAPTRCGRPART